MPAKTETSPPPDATPPPAGSVERRILASARERFFTHGFRGVTMDDLAESLGMSKKTLYAHYPSKTALVEAVVRDKLDRVECSMNEVFTDAPGDFQDRLQALLGRLREQTDELKACFIRDIRREMPELFEVVQAKRAGLIRRFFGKLLQEGRKTGKIRKDIAPEMLIELLMASVDGFVNPAKLEALEITPKIAFSLVVSVFLEGIVVR